MCWSEGFTKRGWYFITTARVTLLFWRSKLQRKTQGPKNLILLCKSEKRIALFGKQQNQSHLSRISVGGFYVERIASHTVFASPWSRHQLGEHGCFLGRFRFLSLHSVVFTEDCAGPKTNWTSKSSQKIAPTIKFLGNYFYLWCIVVFKKIFELLSKLVLTSKFIVISC